MEVYPKIGVPPSPHPFSMKGFSHKKKTIRRVLLGVPPWRAGNLHIFHDVPPFIVFFHPKSSILIGFSLKNQASWGFSYGFPMVWGTPQKERLRRGRGTPQLWKAPSTNVVAREVPVPQPEALKE